MWNTSLQSILKVFIKTVDRLENFADSRTIEALEMREKSISFSKESNNLGDEAKRAKEISQKLRDLLN